MVDLDGDGRAEVIVQGGTDGYAPRGVAIFSLQDGQLTDRVWSTSPGTEVLVVGPVTVSMPTNAAKSTNSSQAP